MKKRNPLPTAPAARESLGLVTIMSRELAQRHGVDYVHIAAFAIDVDRAREGIEVDPEATEWPFAWEILLTEAFLLSRIEPTEERHRLLVEDLCLEIFDHGPGEPRLGDHLLFAIFDAISRAAWPPDWEPIFEGWKAKPKPLIDRLAELRAEGSELIHELSARILELPMDPPLAPSTLSALSTMSRPEA